MEQLQNSPEPKPNLFKRTTSIVEDESMDKKLRSTWTSMFLDYQGFQYILKVFMDKDITTFEQSEGVFNQTFQLKHIAFLLKLLRIFIMAAFSTSKESQVYEVSKLVRKSSSVQEDDYVPKDVIPSEGSRFKELQRLLKGPIGEEIIETIDYKQL